MKKWSYLLIITFLLGACSAGQKALERGDYIQAIEKAVNRLSSNPENRKAKRVVDDGYPMAMKYYQEEIDQTLSGNDQFKWGRTLDIMNRINHLSDLIRRVPAARELVPSPKVYSSELSNATERAAEERYLAGIASMKRPTREDAKEAYYHFQVADELVPSYKDVLNRMNDAKERATIHVVIEPIPVPGKRYQLSSEFFYDEVIKRMNQNFPSSGFVAFYTPDEAESEQLRYPEMIVRLEFYDFSVERPQHFEQVENLSRMVEREVEVKVSRDSTRIEKRHERLTGKIKVITDQVTSQGVLNVQIQEFQSQKMILNEAVPGEFLWQNQYGIFVGDEGVLTDAQVRILNNRAVPPPAPQDLFIEFTRPIFSRVTERLTNYFRKYD